MINTMLGKKIPVTRWAMTIGLGSSLLTMGSTYAQRASNPTTSQAPETAAADRVVITGSNIPTSEEVGASPVDTIDQATRDRTGQEDVLSVLTRSNPAISSGGGNLGQSNASVGQGSSLGGSAISIHGLPTLILLDGRRLTDSSAAAAGGLSFADVNLFPSALVKRIEVLKDGASAIYGTEAVGGVVNVILDQEFQGFEFSGRYGFTEKSDVTNKRFSGIFGFGDDKTHIVVGAEYVEQDPLFNRDRNYASPNFTTSTQFPGVARFNGIAYVLAPGVNSPSDSAGHGTIAQPVNGVNPFPAGVYTTSPTALSLLPYNAGTRNAASGAASGFVESQFDGARVTGLTLDQNRLNIFASADRQLIGDHVVAFADFLYASNYSQSYLNANPLNTGSAATAGSQINIPAAAPFNPFGTAIGSGTAVQVFNRFIGAPRIFRDDTDFYRVVAGLKGQIIPNYNYEVALNSSRDAVSFKNPNLIVASDLNDAIAGGYQANGTTQIAGVTINPATGTPYTVNGPYSIVRGNLQPAVDFFARNQAPGAVANFTGDNIRYLVSSFQGIDGKITAFPVNLPAGPVGFAAGGEYRHEFLKANDSPEIFVNSVAIADLNVGRHVTAGFAEVNIPLVSPDLKIPFLYRADIEGAVRYEAYDPGDSTWVPKVGFTLSPIRDITLRGSFSKSFIAPTLFQSEGPAGTGSTATYNIGGGSEQGNATGGSNPNLGNTRADNYTAGIVISPHFVEGLTLNADFFHVEESGITGVVDPVQAITSTNALGTASPFAGLVHVGSFNGPGVTGPNQLAGNGPNTFVVSNEANLGRERIGGIDFGAHYSHDFGPYGQANIGIDGTYYLQFKVSSLANTPTFDIIGDYLGQAELGSIGLTGVQPYHLTPSVGYTFRGFSAEAIGNYTPGLRNAFSVGTVDPYAAIGGYNTDKPFGGGASGGQANGNPRVLPKIRDYYTIDLLFSYEFHYNSPMPATPTPKDGKDGKGGGKAVVGMEKAASLGSDSPLKFLDGLKLSFGIENVTNARPPLIPASPDASNTDGTIYDLYQRQYYFVITKKF